VFVNERGQPFGRMGIGRMIERAGEAAGLPFSVHVHMLRHSTGYALAARGMDTRRLQHYLGHASITNTVRYTAMSPEPFKGYLAFMRDPKARGAARQAIVAMADVRALRLEPAIGEIRATGALAQIL
jgi:integrase